MRQSPTFRSSRLRREWPERETGRSSYSLHGRPNGMTYWDSLGVEPFQTEHIDAEVVRSNPLSMKRVNAAYLAEKVPRRLGVELVLCEQFVACEQ